MYKLYLGSNNTTKKLETASTTIKVFQAKKIKGNTYKINNTTNDVIRYHETNILTFESDHVTLNSGGWLTKSTKERINEHLPKGVHIMQKDFRWYVIDNRDNTKKDFYDGIIIQNL